MFQSINAAVFLRISGVLFHIKGPMKQYVLSGIFYSKRKNQIQITISCSLIVCSN